MFVVGDWGYVLFLAAADRELFYSLAWLFSVEFYHSGDDPTRLCVVE